MRTIFSILCLIVIVASPAAATTKWVDQAGGSDSNDGNSEATAYQTLQHAINNSASGTAGTPSIINVKDGTYGEDPPLSIGGYLTANLIANIDYLTIQAVPGHEPKLAPVTAVEVDISSLGIDNSDYIVIDNIDSDQTVAEWDHFHIQNSDYFTVKNADFQGGEDGIDWETGATGALIENCNFGDLTEDTIDMSDGTYSGLIVQDCTFEANQRRPFLLRDGTGPTISDITIRRNKFLGTNDQEAIRLIGVSDALLENNVIINSQQQGLYIDSGCSNITVQHNTFYNNGADPGDNGEIKTKVGSSDIVIKNNIFNGNGSNPAIETSLARPLAGEDYNLVFSVTDTVFGPNTTTGDPKFVDTTPGSEDLHLKYGSPALEAGTNLGVTEDHEQSVRPNPVATDPDQGAYEHGPFAIPTVGWIAMFALLGLLALFLTRQTVRRTAAAGS